MPRTYEPLPQNGRIEICGGIASGKTTLAHLLSRLHISPVLENFQANPFWKSFYADPVGTAFETEISFLLQHYHEIKAATKRNHAFTCDFSLMLDLAYAYVTLSERKRNAFLTVWGEIQEDLQAPRLLIHLVCEPDVELDRIRGRAREVEKSITIGYLEALNEALAEVINTEAKSCRVIVINSNAVNFADDEAAKKSVLELTRTNLGHPSAPKRPPYVN